MFCNFYYLKV
jgi:hypothetical protein